MARVIKVVEKSYWHDLSVFIRMVMRMVELMVRMARVVARMAEVVAGMAGVQPAR